MRSWPKLALLWLLYLVQGLPFGYQHTVVPLLLQERGVSLTWVGLSAGLAAPWLLKPLWAPLVDRYGSRRFGRRRSWILGAQLALTGCLLLAAWLLPSAADEAVWPWLLAVAMMNLAAATMDIAVDGLAVDVLSQEELGQGNIAQVVGYKLGMLAGGGLLVWAALYIGERGTLLAMAALVLCAVTVILWFREPAASESGTPGAPPRWAEVALAVWHKPLTKPLLLVVVSYKLGESLADGMFKPWLLSVGIAKEQIGLWVGSWGMAASMLGSVCGGVLAGRLGLLRALWWTSLVRALPLVMQWWLVHNTLNEPAWIISVTCAEHFFGGALTTAMFATMMGSVDRRIGASHFTLLAACEVLGKTPAFWGSGVLADALGFEAVFVSAVVLSLLFLLLLYRMAPRLERAFTPAVSASA